MKILPIILVAFLLSSCAATRQYAIARPDLPAEESASIFIIRPSPIAVSVRAGVYQDGELMGDLGAKNYIRWQVPANGEVIDLMSKTENRSRYSFTPEAGKSYYFKVALRIGIVFTRNKLRLLEEEEGEELLAKLTR